MRKIVILGVIVLIVIGGLGVLIASRPSDNNESTTEAQQESTVTLQGANKSTELDELDNDASKEGIETMVRINEPDSSSNYSAVVRKNTVTRSTTSTGEPRLRYLVDIPELQRTFVVTREGDTSSDYATLYVNCPAASELRYPAKPCQELE